MLHFFKFCLTDNFTVSTNNISLWDDDSVNFQIITRPSANATGSFNLSLTIIDQLNQKSIRKEIIGLNTTIFTGALPAVDVILKTI